MGEELVLSLQRLAQLYGIDLIFQSRSLPPTTIVLCKQRKRCYLTMKSWRPISFIDKLGKVLETIAALYFQDFVQRNDLLPEL